MSERTARRTTLLADPLGTALLHPTHPGLPPVAHRPAWAPCSPCGPDCLPAGPRASLRGTLRVARRLVALGALLLVAPAVLLAGPGPHLFRVVLRAAGVRLRTRGTTYGDGGVLVVANHVSWIDVVALGAVAPVRMIAKREVAGR